MKKLNYPIPDKLFKIDPETTPPEDLKEFWKSRVKLNREVSLNPTLKLLSHPIEQMEVFEVSFTAFDNTTLYGYYILPKKRDKTIPVVIVHHGFTGNKGLAHQYLPYIMMGMAVLAMDIRGQSGKTGDFGNYSSGLNGNLSTLGILDPEEYYHIRMILDALKGVDFVSEREEINKKKIILAGGSQGGGLVITLGALDNRASFLLADVPSDSFLKERVRGNYGKYGNLLNYFNRFPEYEEKVFSTLNYTDTMHLAKDITAPLLASVGGKDPICPAHCFFATYNRITSPKEIVYYPYSGHEGGGETHKEYQLKWLKEKCFT